MEQKHKCTNAEDTDSTKNSATPLPALMLTDRLGQSKVRMTDTMCSNKCVQCVCVHALVVPPSHITADLIAKNLLQTLFSFVDTTKPPAQGWHSWNPAATHIVNIHNGAKIQKRARLGKRAKKTG